MKRLILALLALCYADVALAQTFPKPADVPAYVAVAPLYKTNGTTNSPIDPTVTPPPQAGLTNIAVPSQTGRVDTIAPQSEGVGNFCKSVYYGGLAGCNENKFRTIVDFGFMLPDDPIRNYGQPGQSHLHCFFGAGSTNAYSTYKTLRQHAIDSTAVGTDANGTGYWFPCIVVLNPYSNGKNYAIKPDYLVVYYTNDNTTPKTDIPVGMRYVLGFDMDAAVTSGVPQQYQWLKDILDTANTAQGYTRYTLGNPAGNMIFNAGWNCSGATPTTSKVIVNSDGSDPHAGTCASGADYFEEIAGPDCWDGTNLWSPGGYKHLIPRIWDAQISGWTCPYNYYLTAQLAIQFHFTQNGWTDRQRWALSSDITYRTAKSLTSTQLPSGTTFHTDWMFGWDDTIMQQWEHNCVGTMGNIGHQCNSSVIAIDKQLSNANGTGVGAGGRNPQVSTTSLSHVLETDPGWMLISPAWSGALTNMHMHN